MRVVIDIEANGLKPTEIWVIVCKNIDTNEFYTFRRVTQDQSERERFHAFSEKVDCWVGHNWLGYDYPVLRRLLGFSCDSVATKTVDTLVLSKLLDYSRDGHSVEDYGEEFAVEKVKFADWSVYSPQLEARCVRDVEITHRIYDRLRPRLHEPSLFLEQSFQLLVNDLEDNGFAFNAKKAESLLAQVKEQLDVLDHEIVKAFPPRLTPVRVITPRTTRHGTLNRSDFRWHKSGDLSEFNGGPFTQCVWRSFNPSSHRQIVSVLSDAGWNPVDKTGTHIDTERIASRLKYQRYRSVEIDKQLEDCYAKLKLLKKFGWRVNENNLATLPISAPKATHTLAKRILLESRRRTLVEWLECVSDDGRIHGKFYGIGAWTHRMAHQNPNTANIPQALKEDGTPKLLGKELRSLWCSPKNRLLVGVDAEGIQLRIFAHYIDDQEFTDALVRGSKTRKTDPHSLNQRILGSACKSRQAAKRFIYALLLGGGLGKLAEILGCERVEAQQALDRLLERYEGFGILKTEVIPKDAERGYFVGLDGRRVRIPGDTVGNRKHLCMSGYLQNGEAVIMKKAALLWNAELREHDDLGRWLFVNQVHDEWQTECKNDMKIALKIAKIQANSLVQAGEFYNLKCPMAGSYWNEEHKDYTIGTNWYQTH